MGEVSKAGALSAAVLVAWLGTASASAAPAPLGLQPAGRIFTDPGFDVRLVRLSDASDRGGFETHLYSQLQPFSTDMRYVLLTGPNGYLVRRLSDRAVLGRLGSPSWNTPRWDPARAHAIVHFDSNEDRVLRLQRTDVATRRTRTILTFPARFERILSNQSFDELSRDGRWLAGMASGARGERLVFTVDLSQRRLGTTLALHQLYVAGCSPDPRHGELEPDWVGVSPLGRYLVIQWQRDGRRRCSGLETYRLRGGRFVGRVYDGHQHGDLGLARGGRSELFMTFELYHRSGLPYLGTRALPGPVRGASAPRYLTRLAWDQGGHISCAGPAGACLVTTGSDPSNGFGRLEGEVFIQSTGGGIRRLAKHRSSSCGYWAQPRASWSRDGRLAIFASDWGRGGGDCGGRERSDPYLVLIRAR